jgi:hypothetical protein
MPTNVSMDDEQLNNGKDDEDGINISSEYHASDNASDGGDDDNKEAAGPNILGLSKARIRLVCIAKYAQRQPN